MSRYCRLITGDAQSLLFERSAIFGAGAHPAFHIRSQLRSSRYGISSTLLPCVERGTSYIPAFAVLFQ